MLDQGAVILVGAAPGDHDDLVGLAELGAGREVMTLNSWIPSSGGNSPWPRSIHAVEFGHAVEGEGDDCVVEAPLTVGCTP